MVKMGGFEGLGTHLFDATVVVFTNGFVFKLGDFGGCGKVDFKVHFVSF